MLEISETTNTAIQAVEMLTGKTIADVVLATSPHKFAWYNGDDKDYLDLLIGRTVTGAVGHGAYITIDFDKDVHLAFGDGAYPKFGWAEDPRPAKHQLLLEFSDGTFLSVSVAMYGAILAFRGELDNMYYKVSLEKTSPLDPDFDRSYFDKLRSDVKPNYSVKAFLATEQRIPGLGNGTLQDILFLAKLNPKRKIATLSEKDWSVLFDTLKRTIFEMTEKGGRDTERNLLGQYGSYLTLLSKNTWKNPCPVCGDKIVKEPYLGGAVYYCPTCQPL